MLSVDNIVLPDIDDTRCGVTTKMLNPDIDMNKEIAIYKRYIYREEDQGKRFPADGNFHDKYTTDISENKNPPRIEDLKRITELLFKHGKVIVKIDIAGWFSHMFTLYNTVDGIYIAESYIFHKTIEKRPFDLDKLYEMLLKVSKYVGFYEKIEVSVMDGEIEREKLSDHTSDKTFDECAKIWYDFWGGYHVTGSRGNLDYYTITCCHEIKDIIFYKCDKCGRININNQDLHVEKCYDCIHQENNTEIKESKENSPRELKSKETVIDGINDLLSEVRRINGKKQKVEIIIKLFKFINQNMLIINTSIANNFPKIVVTKLFEFITQYKKLFAAHTEVFNETLKYIQVDWNNWNVDDLNFDI